MDQQVLAGPEPYRLPTSSKRPRFSPPPSSVHVSRSLSLHLVWVTGRAQQGRKAGVNAEARLWSLTRGKGGEMAENHMSALLERLPCHQLSAHESRRESNIPHIGTLA